MTRVARRAARLAFALAVAAGTPVNAQSLTSTTGAALSIAAPTEAAYDAGVSAASGNYTVRTTCTGGGSSGCRLFLRYGTNSQGQQVDMQYAVVSLGSAACQGAVANPNSWLAVQPTAVVLSTVKGVNCVATFRFRVSPLSYALYQSPGPSSGSYRQRVAFQLTRP